MRAFIVGIGIAASLLSGAAFGQATSGGQAPMADGNIRNTDTGGGSLTDQYLHQRALNNLPGQEAPVVNRSKLGPSRPAKASELSAGAVINDKAGVAIAKIEKVDTDGVVVVTGLRKIKVPAEAFGHNKAGLLLDMTKAQFDQVVAQANAGS